MTISQFEQFEALQDVLADSCNALLRRYQELRKEILNDQKQNKNLRFDRLDSISELPYVAEPEPYEIEFGLKKMPTIWEQRMEHTRIRYKAYLGYDSEYEFTDLPFRWLFDANWEDEAFPRLTIEAARNESIRQRTTEVFERQERANFERLKQKYGN